MKTDLRTNRDIDKNIYKTNIYWQEVTKLVPTIYQLSEGLALCAFRCPITLHEGSSQGRHNILETGFSETAEHIRQPDTLGHEILQDLVPRIIFF